MGDPRDKIGSSKVHASFKIENLISVSIINITPPRDLVSGDVI